MVEPPNALKIEYFWTPPNSDPISDEYSWMSDFDSQIVQDLIASEQLYADSSLAELKDSREALFDEIWSRSHGNQTNKNAAYVLGDFSYYMKRQSDLPYPIHYRFNNAEVDKEEEILNPNTLEKDVPTLVLSPSGRYICFAVDTRGDEELTLMFKDLNTNELMDDSIEGCYYGIAWDGDGSIYYSKLNDQGRSFEVYRHILGQTEDDLIYQENDERMWVYVKDSNCRSQVLINSASAETSVCMWVEDKEVHTLIEKKESVSYDALPYGKRWIVMSNEDENRNKLVFMVDDEGQNRITLIESRPFVLIDSIDVRESFLVAFERTNGLQNIRVSQLNETGIEDFYYISLPGMLYSIWPGDMYDCDRDGVLYGQCNFYSNTIRFTFSSLVKPRAVIDYDMISKESTVAYEEIISDYVMDDYVQLRWAAISEDGTAVPVSILYRKEKYVEGKPSPCIVTGYGAYGSSVEAGFSSSRLSLVDRGFVFAQAHVRGGSELGTSWHEGGRGLNKENSFKDLLAVCELLIQKGITSPDFLCLHGRSAGGLLVAATLNLAPHLFHAVWIEVPFVDVLSTVCDSEQVWTSFEYEEWGDPTDPEVIEVIKRYCPYQNIKETAYPTMLITCGLNDTRVGIQEPLKYAARLRSRMTNSNKIIVKISGLGHLKGENIAVDIEESAAGSAFLMNSVGIPVEREKVLQSPRYFERKRKTRLRRDQALI